MFTPEHMAAAAAQREQEKRDHFRLWLESPAAGMIRTLIGGHREQGIAALEIVFNAGFDTGSSGMLMHVLTVVVNPKREDAPAVEKLPRMKRVG